MKRGGNSNKTNLLFVCCVVIAAVLFVVNTVRIPDTGGGTTVNSIQVVENAGNPDSPPEGSAEAADRQSQDEDRGNSSQGSAEATDRQSQDEDGNDSPEGSAEMADGQPDAEGEGVDGPLENPPQTSDARPGAGDNGADSLPEEPSESIPKMAESIPESAAVILEGTQSAQWSEAPQAQLYSFRNERLLNQHYEKHGIEMGFATIEEYVAAANAVINHPDVLHKQEAEDNDDVYFLEATNEFVVVSTDGYIRTYFIASGGIDYYNRQ